MRRLAKRGTVAHYLVFVAGIQISAGIGLLVETYFADLQWKEAFFTIASGLILGASSYFSLVLGSEIEYVVTSAERAVWTLVDANDVMDSKLNEDVPTFLRRQIKRIDRMKIILYTDVSILVLGFAVLIMGACLRN